MNRFLENDLSLESQWRSLIQFGGNSAPHKFSVEKTLLELFKSNKSHLNLKDLSEPFAINMVEHLKKITSKDTLYHLIPRYTGDMKKPKGVYDIV